MSKKSKKKRVGIVYSTNPDYEYSYEDENPFAKIGGAKASSLRVSPERKGRGGKTVTIIRGYAGNSEDLKKLGKELKQSCGVGGSVKQGEIILQGDHVDQVVKKLLDLGYPNAKRGGG